MHNNKPFGNGQPLNLIIHPGPNVPQLPEGKLPPASPDVLGHVHRGLDDWPADRGVKGYSAHSIALLGLKYSKKGITLERLGLSIPRDRAIIATRSTTGRVTGLLTTDRWLTAPQIDVSNPMRRHATGQIEVFADVLEAQIAALERNICAISLGGRELRQVSQHLIGPNPRVIHTEERWAA